MNFAKIIAESPIIAAVKDEAGLEASLKSDCRIIFTLSGTILDIGDMVAKIREAGRIAIVHADFVSGLSGKDVAADYLKKVVGADGVISTKGMIVKRAKEIGMISVQRTFVVDSIALSNMKKQLDVFKPDAVEILPGLMPKILHEMKEYAGIPVIAGGLLSDKKDVMDALKAGADAISTSKEALWYV